MNTKIYNEQITNEIKKIKMPIKNKNGTLVVFSAGSKKQKTINHIGLARHRLKVRDIKELPNIIQNPKKVLKDKKGKDKKIYVGNRPGRERMSLALVTRKRQNCEEIITYYPTKKY